MLTGIELAREKIISNIAQENIQQHGIDLNLIRVETFSGHGAIYSNSTTTPDYRVKESFNGIWLLDKGIYNVTFAQGCDIPANRVLLIRQRSSLARCGGQIQSGIFDAGFKTKNIGAIMIIDNLMQIEVGARIAVIYCHATNNVENLYSGQFQNDIKR